MACVRVVLVEPKQKKTMTLSETFRAMQSCLVPQDQTSSIICHRPLLTYVTGGGQLGGCMDRWQTKTLNHKCLRKSKSVAHKVFQKFGSSVRL